MGENITSEELEQMWNTASEHMQKLMDAMPAMEAKKAELDGAQRAQTVAEAEKQYLLRKKKSEEKEAWLEKRTRRMISGEEQDESDAQKKQRVQDQEIDYKNLTFLQEETMGYRTAYHQKMKQMKFKKEEDYKAAKRDPDKIRALQQEIGDFQKEYQEVLAECQRISALMPEEE